MKTRKIHPYILIILTFIGVILIGTALLALPISSTNNQSFGLIDSLFMATSCVCVTGLSVMENSIAADMTYFGKAVMVVLMEVGGLSFITIAIFFFTIIGGKIGFSNKFMLREALNQNTANGLLALVKKIVITSFMIQIIATLINWYPLIEYCDTIYGASDSNIWKALIMSVYHSAAAFNNAGFDIFGSNSMENFASNANVISQSSMLIINTTTILLIVLGGIGFIIIDDILKNKKWKKLSLHSKITLIATFILIFGGALLFKLTSNMGYLEALFSSVTARTAGFATYNMTNLKDYPVAYFIMIILMIIGASPCSTGGGIKSTTFAVVVLAIVHFAMGKKTKVFERRLMHDQIFKAFVLISIATGIVLLGTMVILATQPELGIDCVLFEVSSAFSTTGLSMGITTSLSSFNRIVVCVLMLFGRLGPLTIIGVVNKNWLAGENERIQYIEESVIIG